jgi:hypothetical protein
LLHDLIFVFINFENENGSRIICSFFGIPLSLIEETKPLPLRNCREKLYHARPAQSRFFPVPGKMY